MSTSTKEPTGQWSSVLFMLLEEIRLSCEIVENLKLHHQLQGVTLTAVSHSWMWSNKAIKQFSTALRQKPLGCTNELGLREVTDGQFMNKVKANVKHQLLQHSLCNVNICTLTSLQKKLKKGKCSETWHEWGKTFPCVDRHSSAYHQVYRVHLKKAHHWIINAITFSFF